MMLWNYQMPPQLATANDSRAGSSIMKHRSIPGSRDSDANGFLHGHSLQREMSMG
jgi:hypothetical protein